MWEDPREIERQRIADEEYRKKMEAEAKERARLREIAQTKTVRCTVVHGSRIGIRAKGYGIGVADEGGHCIIVRLVRVQYMEDFEEKTPEASPDKRFGPLQLGDRIVKVDGTATLKFDEALEKIKSGGELLELSVLRDPESAAPEFKEWRRDRLWNWSTTAYWTIFFSMLALGICGLTWIAWKLSQLEPGPVPEGAHMNPYGYRGGRHFMEEL